MLRSFRFNKLIVTRRKSETEILPSLLVVKSVRTSLPFISTILNTASLRVEPSMSSTLESSTAPFVKLFVAVTEAIFLALLTVNLIGVSFKS